MTILDYTNLMNAQTQVLAMVQDNSDAVTQKVGQIMPELMEIAQTADEATRKNALKVADTFGIALLAAQKKNATPNATLDDLIQKLADMLRKAEPAVISVMIRLIGNPQMTMDFLRNNQDFSHLKTESIFEDSNRQLLALQLLEPQAVQAPAA